MNLICKVRIVFSKHFCLTWFLYLQLFLWNINFISTFIKHLTFSICTPSSNVSRKVFLRYCNFKVKWWAFTKEEEDGYSIYSNRDEYKEPTFSFSNGYCLLMASSSLAHFSFKVSNIFTNKPSTMSITCMNNCRLKAIKTNIQTAQAFKINTYLWIVLLNPHFNIKTNKLTQMSMSKRVLSPVYCANLEHTVETTTNGHLFMKLRWLRQTSRCSFVFQPKDGCTAFTRTRNQFRGVDPTKTFG